MGPICLPDPAEDYEDVRGLVTGWGIIKYHPLFPQHTDTLQRVNVTTMTNQQCRGIYNRTSITEFMICAGDVGKDACRGDSGGPLTVEGPDGRYSQIGIVSWGKNCGRKKGRRAGVYTRLTSLLDWVRSMISTPAAEGSLLIV